MSIRNVKNSLLALLVFCMAASGCTQEPRKPRLISASGTEIRDIIGELSGKTDLVNAWATWCIPCWEEFPDILKLYQTYKDDGLRLILVSSDYGDQTETVETFLEEHGVDFDTYISEDGDTGFIQAMDEEWSGALPATWVYSAKGARTAFWEGKADYDRFEKEILAILK